LVMNPNREGPINFELPPRPPSPEDEPGQEQTVEAPAARPETAGKQAKQPALPVIPDDVPAVDQPVIAAPPQDVATPVPTDPKAIAEDTERIEREWVDKVKHIIAGTQDDPFQQKDQMSRVKAEYIQKRFNKTIKTDEKE
jgi:hypothetical protein